eukprot:15609514-Heterocapsa_arctica.AAC.1
MYDILKRIQEVLDIASAMEPPFHGGSDGQVAEAIAEGLRQQLMGCIGWYMRASTVVQLQWE